MRPLGLGCLLAALALSAGASSSSDFVRAARAEYPNGTPTNSIVRRYVGKASDFSDRPVAGDLVRWIKVDGARNVRDLGGWNGLRTGRVYRGSELNSVTNHGLAVSPEGLRTLREELKIRTDLDFRAVTAAQRGACVKVSAMGADVRLLDFPIPSYGEMFKPAHANLFAGVLRVFADSRNYPIYMHCWGGADRTGTVAFILEGLCGVSETDAAIDYELTSFAGVFGVRARDFAWPDQRNRVLYRELIDGLRAYPGATYNERLENYAKTTLGLTAGEISAIRSNLTAQQ